MQHQAAGLDPCMGPVPCSGTWQEARRSDNKIDVGADIGAGGVVSWASITWTAASDLQGGRRRAAFAAFGLNNKAVLQSADSHAHQHLTHPGVPEQSPESHQSQSPSPPGMSCHLAAVASRFIRPPWRLSRDGGGTLPVLGLASDRPRRAPPCRGQDHGLPWTRDASCHIIHQPSATGRATPARHAINRARHGHSGTNTRTPSTAISGTLLRHAGLAAG